MPNPFEQILEQVRTLDLAGFDLRLAAMKLLDTLPHYDWSGVYRLEGDELILDAYVGAETDHVRIPIGTGVCGTAVAEDRNQVVADVRELSNYLSCSVSTRSEIVVLIRSDEGLLGQIDIDSHTVNAFGKEDESFLEALGDILAGRWS